MKIILTSDLHISPSADRRYLIDNFCESLRQIVSPVEELVIFVFGDITVKGNKDFFQEAAKNLDYILEQLKGWSVTFEFIPGNHDICDSSLGDFDDFTERYLRTKHRFSEISAYSKVYEDVNFIFASSTVDCDHSYGNIDIETIRLNLKKDKNNVLLVHHSLISEYKKETTMTDVPSIYKFLIDNKIEFVLHGHTHASRSIPFINNLKLIGTGSLLAEISGNENNQFNVLGINNGRIISVVNYRFISDTGSFTACFDLYPAEKNFADPSQIKRHRYEAVTNYIVRKVWPCSTSTADEVTRIFSSNEKKTLLDVCKTEKTNLIILLGEAGTGKSYELIQLAHQLSQDGSPYYPVRINLNTYSGQELIELLKGDYEAYKNLRSECIFWIIDGFDEIDPELVLKFKRNLKTYRDENPQTHILLSSRTNFLKTKTPDGNWGTFANSVEYSLCSLEITDVIDYVTAQGIDSEKFLAEIKDKGLSDLLYIPFYLIKLTDIYNKEGQLPNKSNLMDTLISICFRYDNDKYEYTIDLYEKESELIKHIERAAMALQLLNRNYVTEAEYQCLFSGSIRNELLKFNGLWVQSQGTWAFSHNNFREYLAARLLSKLSFGQILNYIAYAGTEPEIKPEWFNTLSFLLTLYEPNDLQDWLSVNTPFALVKFESDRVHAEQRFSILKCIFLELKEKNLWFESELCSERELAIFSESPEAVDYLLKELITADSDHFRAQYIALSLLINFDNYFGKTEEIRTTLLTYISKPETRNYEIGQAIKVLGHRSLNSIEITEKLMVQFSNTSNDSIRHSIYEYLVDTDNQDSYVDFFISGIKYADRRHVTNVSELYALTEGIKKLSSADALRKALIFLSKTIGRPSLHAEAEIFDLLCGKAEVLFQNGDKSVFDTLLTAFCTAADEMETHYPKRILQFFDRTRTRKSALYHVLSQKLKHMIFVLIDLIDTDQECLAAFAELYENDELSDSSLFYQFALRMPQTTQEFGYFSELLKTKEGIEIPTKEIINYEQLRLDGRQNFFNALFDESSLRKLLDELLMLYGQDITTEQLVDAEPLEKRHDIELFKWAIYRFGNTCDRTANFFINVPWKSFTIYELYQFLSNKNTSFIINESQQMFINQIFNEIISRTDFNAATSYGDDNNWSFTYDSIIAICFMQNLNLSCPEDVLLDMLMMPPHYFKGEDYKEKDLAYISSRVSFEKLKSRIIYNVENQTLMGDVFISHVEFCTENGLANAIPIAFDVCTDTKRSSIVKRTAFEYLLKIQGEEYIYDQVVPNTDDELFMDIVRELHKNKNEKLERAIIAKLKVSDNLELLQYLIVMNSEFGLDHYIKMVKDSNKTPDNREQIPHITESIKSIRDIRLLPKLIDLAELQFRKGFKDNSIRSLHNCLTRSLIAMGTKDDYEKVKTALERLKSKLENNASCIYFCNTMLDELRRQNLKDNDSKYTITDITKLFREFDEIS